MKNIHKSTVFLPVVKMATSPYYRNTVEPEERYQISLNEFGIGVGNNNDVSNTVVQTNLNQN